MAKRKIELYSEDLCVWLEVPDLTWVKKREVFRIVKPDGDVIGEFVSKGEFIVGEEGTLYVTCNQL